MELNFYQKSDIQNQENFKDIDVSNWYEFVVMFLLSVGGNLILIKIFRKFKIYLSGKQRIRKQSFQNVNCKLLISNHNNIQDLFMLLLNSGFLFSQIWQWDCKTQISSLTLSPQLYIIIQICQAQTLNLTYCFCSNLWLRLWRMKLRIEQNQSLLGLTNVLKVFLSLLIVLIPILTIVSLILESYINNIREYCLGALTMLSTISFAAICIILYTKLKDQFSIGDHYSANLKFLSIAVIICSLIRPSFNFSQEFFWKLKPGLECDEDDVLINKLPDQGISWAAFQLIYSCITDFIPIYILSLLFSPNTSKRKTLVDANNDSDYIQE